MLICKNCGVELEDDMVTCPLCGETVGSNNSFRSQEINRQSPFRYDRMSQPQRKFTWEIISVILFSGAIATFVVDFIINHLITWSELPVAISVSVFCYISLFAFWHKKNIIQMAGGFILASLCLVALDALTGGIQWSLTLGVPLLFASNVVILTLMAAIKQSRYKGINLIAYAFLGAALLCMCVDSALSFFRKGTFGITWSIIVAGCTVPVVLTLLFVHFRLKRGRSLEKTFHI